MNQPPSAPKMPSALTPLASLAFLTPAQAAAELGVKRGYIDQQIAAGEIAVTRPGRLVRIRRVEWERWLASISSPSTAAA